MKKFTVFILFVFCFSGIKSQDTCHTSKIGKLILKPISKNNVVDSSLARKPGKDPTGLPNVVIIEEGSNIAQIERYENIGDTSIHIQLIEAQGTEECHFALLIIADDKIVRSFPLYGDGTLWLREAYDKNIADQKQMAIDRYLKIFK